MPNIEVIFLDTGQKEEHKLNNKKFVIGRSSKADLVIDREEFSRFHLEVDCSDDNIFLTDLNSTNGVFVNGERIPKGVRIPHQLMFPIEIAGKVSLSLSLEDNSAPIKPIDFASSTLKSNSENSLSHRKSLTPKNENNKALNSKKTLRPQKSEPKKSTFIMIFVLAIIGYFAYSQILKTQLNEENKNLESNTTNTESTKNQSKLNFNEINLKSYRQNNQCSEMGDLCSFLGVDNDQGSLHKTNKELFIFVNLSKKSIQNPHKSFEELDEMKKSEIILSEIGSLRKLMLKVTELKLSKLIIVGYGEIDSSIFLKMAIDVDFNSLLKLPGNLNLFFSDLYFGGITRGYRNNIVPHQTIYEL